MLILGLNAFHGDSAACVIEDGQLLAAAEEERFRRVKHWAGFPVEAIRYCLSEAGAKLSDVAHIAINQDNRANQMKRVTYLLRHRPDLGSVLARLRNRHARYSTGDFLSESFAGDLFRGKIHRIEHHLAHLASSFQVSPFQEAVAVSVDGFGDFASAAWGIGRDSGLSIEGRVYFPHSLGIFYQALTQYLGFPDFGDEFKVMGLAPYGQPRNLAAMREIVKLQRDGRFVLDLTYFRHHHEDVPYQWSDGSPTTGDLFSSRLEELFGPRRKPSESLEARHYDIARSVQAMYEEAFFNLLGVLQARSGITNLALAGGCAANSVANGKVRRVTPFRRVYVQPAAGDAGGAIGAAFTVWHELGHPRSFRMAHAYWGPGFDSADFASLLNARSRELSERNCLLDKAESEGALHRQTAIAIADGKVVGWFQGRMEWGPRALGNRSIICDPRRADMKKILNERIKRREDFRPFAPSILEGAISDWFEEDTHVPFMMQVFQIRKEKREQIPAVTHVDGSGRLQTVSPDTNPRFYGLIEAFCELTSVPMVLNTSFNENEPIVCQPEEALDCFLRTKMDLLVLGDHFVRRLE